jgi:para-nitrobenzyl esterase
VDGYLAPESPLDAMLEGKLNDVPTLAGCNADEITGSILGPGGPIKPDEFHKQSGRKFGDQAGEFLKLYPAATDVEAMRARSGSSRDESLIGMYLWARKRDASMKTPTYIYLWDHVLPGPEAAKWGAFHTSEVPYAMNTLYTSDRPFTDADRKIAGMMSSYWANFATTGDPNGKGLQHWPAVGAKPEVMELGDRTAPVPLASDQAKVAFFEQYLSR